jgi:hypothetical protein
MVIICLLALGLVFCSLPAGLQMTTTQPSANETALLQTAAAGAAETFTQLAGAGQPGVTPPPLATDAPTLTPSPSPSPTLQFPLIFMGTDTNCRTGPGQVYDMVGGLQVGESAEAYARDPSGLYWYVRNPDDVNGFCWLWGYYATVIGNTDILPVFTPPATPTPVASFTFSYKTWGVGPGYQCLMFEVKNTGGLTWESFRLSFHDLTHGDTTTSSSDEFTSYDGWCGITGSQSDLMPGEIGLTSVKTFMVHNPSGDNMEFTLMLCSNNSLAGSCLTQTLTIIF